MQDIHYWSVAETASRLRDGTVSVTEITQAHLDRMQAVNPVINAITTPVHEALDVARALDDAGMPDDAGPLWGVPVTTKINIDQAGYVNSNGVAAAAGAVSDADSPLVTNLRNGGAVIIGRTSTPEFSMRWFTSNPTDGVTHNPWDAGLTPGGSSGAAAAAVASGIGAVAHGNDLGGSLRHPAYCCGVATIRPSLGRIPAMNPTQSAAGIERGPITQLMAVQGPIARCIADVRAGLDAMAGFDDRDPLWTAAPQSRRDGAGKVRVGYAMNPFGGALDPKVEAAMLRAIDGLKAAGCDLREVSPPHAEECPALWGRLMFTESETLSRDAIMAQGSDAMRAYYEAFAAWFEPTDLTGLLTAMQRRIVFQRAWARMFRDIDLMLLPTSLARPFANDQDFNRPDSLPEIIAAQAPLLTINLLGLPSAALPTHLEGSVPLGVQLVGPMHEDYFVLDVAERLERELGTIWQHLPDLAG
ncbi:amidase [Pukyongiella litopenaei]|uniref:Amidase n=1 Tax=Pukyongiella litopenaei TaxID=2605946 RepID=A0A2S0MP38_9RHOB|nr:amidase [Pukyongiella litopenaei]AVO37521.1 amidase [Pukyongiella litopenaei]